MEPITWALVAAGAVVLLLLLVLAVRARRRRRVAGRSAALRERFGPEYDRAVADRGRDDAEADLETRVDRYRRAPARPLPRDARRQAMQRWSELQAAYVDDPRVAIQRAEALLRQILDEREMPADRLDDRVTAAAFVRPGLADQYRHAHQVFVDVEAERTGPSDEHDQRMAFLVYRELVLEHTREPSGDHVEVIDEVRVADIPVTTGQPAG
jgi:FtsZ-interacting cell division protein ZipA